MEKSNTFLQTATFSNTCINWAAIDSNDDHALSSQISLICYSRRSKDIPSLKEVRFWNTLYKNFIVFSFNKTSLLTKVTFKRSYLPTKFECITPFTGPNTNACCGAWCCGVAE